MFYLNRAEVVWREDEFRSTKAHVGGIRIPTAKRGPAVLPPAALTARSQFGAPRRCRHQPQSRHHAVSRLRLGPRH